MIAVIDYGAGNLFSVANALKYLGVEYKITADIAEIKSASGYILPGVGAFGYAMEMLEKTGLIQTIKEEINTKPLLGICLGMQMLFDSSNEFGQTTGLGLISGEIKEIEDTGLIIPHMGWNELVINDEKNPMLKGINSGDCVYFVHSFMAYTEPENITAHCEYGVKVPAIVHKGNVFGAQFHPEKSGEVGLLMLKNFCELVD